MRHLHVQDQTFELFRICFFSRPNDDMRFLAVTQFVKRIEGSGARPSLTALFAVRFFKLNYYYFALRYLLDSGSFLFEVLVLNAVIHWTVRCRQMQCDKGRTILAAALLAPKLRLSSEW